MGKADQVSSIFWLLLGLVVVYSSYRFGLGTLARPGPGFLPFLCGVILSALSAFVFFQGRLAKKTNGEESIGQLWAGMNWHKPVYGIIVLLIYALTFVRLGFLLSTIFLLIFLFKGIEPERWLRAITVAVLAAVVSYVLFVVWLQVQLPRGLLERLLF
jgi:putative tricarboxylic transport membrane protein